MKPYKRKLSILLSAVMLISIALQMSPLEVQAGNTLEELAAVVEPQIRAYADTIDQDDATSDAAIDLATHGMLGKGKKMKMDTKDPLTAALFNSELVQEGFSMNFAYIIQTMQRMGMKTVPGVHMVFGWYGKNSNYGSYILSDSEEYPDNLDWQVSNVSYTGSQNAYDNSMEWMVGQGNAELVITCIKDTGSEKTYQVDVVFKDRFDFSTANTAGFKKLLSAIGMRLFREFDWECSATMNITVPHAYDHCSHASGNYHWTYDSANYAMISDDNQATHYSKTAQDGSVHHYYELDYTVRLNHDKPWVLEYDVCAPNRIVFAPVDNAVTKTYPQIAHSARTSLFVTSKDYAMAENTDGSMDRFYAYNYYGTKLQDLYKFDSNKTYTFRLENELAGDGNNTIYLTAIDTETGECCLNRIPMDDYYYYGGWMDETVLKSETSNWLSGKNIYINYIGTGITGFQAKTFDLRIWENGKDAQPENYYSSEETKPTCTAGGYTTHTCTVCGYRYQDAYTNKKGHTAGDWIVVKEPTSTMTGLKKKTCTACGIVLEEEVLPVRMLPGDSNSDGELNGKDVIAIRRHLAGGYDVVINLEASDVNNDGVVNGKDVIAIRRYLAGGYDVELI